METPEANLSQFMQQLLTSYARYMNRKYKLVGHVFQGRFGSSHRYYLSPAERPLLVQATDLARILNRDISTISQAVKRTISEKGLAETDEMRCLKKALAKSVNLQA